MPTIDSGRPPPSPLPQAGGGARLALLTFAAALLIAGFVALGIWQVHRLAWKRDLIARVDARVHAPAGPPPARWAQVTAEGDAYRHVRVVGRYLAGRDTLVQAVTDLGAGFWVMTPLRSDAGDTVLINRGFIPAEARSAVPPPPPGSVAVAGLLRMTEPKGGFLRSNDPATDRWYARDVAAIAARRGVAPAAPYFIDAEAGADRGALPVAGLTVVAFPNSHLQYALTWFGLAALVAGGYAIAMREEFRLRRVAG